MIVQIKVGAKHHLNLGNYESMEVEAEVTINTDGNFEVARVEAQEVLTKLLSDSFYNQKTPTWFAHVASKKRMIAHG